MHKFYFLYVHQVSKIPKTSMLTTDPWEQFYCLNVAVMVTWDHSIIESLRLEKTSRITKSPGISQLRTQQPSSPLGIVSSLPDLCRRFRHPRGFRWHQTPQGGVSAVLQGAHWHCWHTYRYSSVVLMPIPTAGEMKNIPMSSHSLLTR